MQPLHPKVKAGATAGGVGLPGAVILVWLLEVAGLDVPPEVASAIGSLLTGIPALIAGYRQAA